MKRITTFTKIACFALVAAALVGTPSISRAQSSTNAPAAQPPVMKKHLPPIHGKVAAVDANAMTFTIGESTFSVTSDTKIFKDHKPAVFSDITAGESALCIYKKDDAGKMDALRVMIGVPERKAPPATPATPAPAAPAAPAPGQ